MGFSRTNPNAPRKLQSQLSYPKEPPRYASKIGNIVPVSQPRGSRARHRKKILGLIFSPLSGPRLIEPSPLNKFVDYCVHCILRLKFIKGSNAPCTRASGPRCPNLA
ncbi:unnamed protein product [Kuraishia capsulata CBS 1993]|uniref:Uncharacterized protein n=1 Tax=Kuraishia capsulata CBS 1993 TaxID=1382522 RepID=W6MPS2_9ASCO|nr:uncharacterized protein KUCA_T00004630001 [Kuraishia capsulata CBS 1993]CDK28646.1 unnamed protein product [Kuraishia capsulata CBS 1993]